MKNLLIVIIAIVCLVAPAVLAQNKVTQFTADVFVTNDPKMNKGSGLTINKLYYNYDKRLMKVEFPKLKEPNGSGAKEIYNYGLNQVYQLCKECSLYRHSLSQPEYFADSDDKKIEGNTFTSKELGECQAYQKTNPTNAGQISIVWVNGKGLPCKAQQTDNTILTFSNVVQGEPPAREFEIPASANCPKKPTCASPIDLVLVFDQSGSIKPNEWQQLLTFGNQVIDSFEIGPTKTQIGLVFFSGVDYQDNQNPASCCGLSDPVLPLSFDKSTIKKFLNSHRQTGQHTCINCGIKDATKYEPNPNRLFQVPYIMIVLTDGFNNRMVNFFTFDIASAKSKGWRMFAIGVKRADKAELATIASTPVNDHLFFVEDFSLLKSILEKLVTNVCGEFPNLTPCGPLCKGKCTCGGQCLCPDTCSTGGDKCATSVCVQNEAGSGCRITKKVCDPVADKCQNNVCNPATGQCELKAKTCKAPDACTDSKCDPKVGCVYADKCNAKVTLGTNDNLCFKRVCTPSGVCDASEIKCDVSDQCVTSKCDPKVGCVKTPKNCDDGNLCTVNGCDPKKGCVVLREIQCPEPGFFTSKEYLDNKSKYNCASFRCDPKVGCTTTPKICDDNNSCTEDSCDPATGKCVYTKIQCPQPTNKCLTSKCDPKVGCQQITKNCDDGNPCTKDSCDPVSGNCVNQKITCPAGDACFDSVCDPKAGKCVAVPKIICDQPNDKCFTNKCDPSTKQCVPAVRQCAAPADKCQNVICDSVLGCITSPVNCGADAAVAADPCKKARCDPIQGCIVETIAGCNNTQCVNCTSTDPCNPKTCENGKCIVKPFVCDTSNKCATIKPTVKEGKCVCEATQQKSCPKPSGGTCGEGVCDPATGECVTKSDRDCGNTDPCVVAKCVVDSNGNKTCEFTGIKCKGDTPCSRKKCINDNGVPKCVDDNENGVKCEDNSECSTAKCDPITGQCVYEKKECDTINDLCVGLKCNPKTGKCEGRAGLDCPPNDLLGCGKGGKCVTLDNKPTCTYEPFCPENVSACIITNCTNGNCQSFTVNCDDGDPCTTNDKCIPITNPDGTEGTKCEYTPFNCPAASDPCKINKCVNENGVAKCVETDVVCDDGNNCTTGACVNGKCIFSEIDCGKGDVCAIHSCDPVNGCFSKAKCNDSNPCTKDLCDPNTGNCSFVPLNCTSDDPCKVAVCDELAGCVLTPYDCATNATFNKTIDECHFPVCDPIQGCILNVVPNTLDACGRCKGNDTCRSANATTTTNVAATVGGVVGGAVVVGAAAVGLGVLLAKWFADKPGAGGDNAIVGADTNPLYEQGGDEGYNPLN